VTHLVLKVALLHFFVQFLELKSLSSEPIDRTGDELLLDILSQLIVQFEAFLNIRCSIIVVLVCGSLWWREEVEEGLRGDGLLNDTGLLGICVSD